MEERGLPCGSVDRFLLSTDWASGYAGYELLAETSQGLVLVDLGSKKMEDPYSSFLGELSALQWALKSTKGLRGWRATSALVDNKGVVDRWSQETFKLDDVRVARRLGWILANEPGLELEYQPGVRNWVADLLTRPVK